MDYFVAREVTRGVNPQVVGDYILSGGLRFPAGGVAEDPETLAKQVRLPKKLEVKWVLPPRTSMFYNAIKGFAQNAGYETVEHDDFTYPGPRI